MLALFVAQGSVTLRVRVLDASESVRIDVPNAQLSLTRAGQYRIEVDADRTRTRVVVREGEAIVITAGREQQVLPGQTAIVSGATGALVDVRNGFSSDALDGWSAQRDRRYDRARNSGYVSPQMIGQADLEQHGAWSSYPEYGSVWFPSSVPSEWAPYRFGRWTWVSGWGWTWVDDAPWGYAPFHYGRWVFVGSRWGWAPGGFVARPLWSPAMVGWIGGPGLSVSVSVGGPVFGWVPLGWGEPLMPWWNNCSHRCWTRLNRPFAVNYAERPSAPPTRYVNWSAPGGATAVGGVTLSRRAPVQSNMVPLRPGSFSSAAVLPQAPQVARPRPNTISGARPVQAPPPAPSRIYRERPVEAALPGMSPTRPVTRAPGASPGMSPGLPAGTARPSASVPAAPQGERPVTRGGSSLPSTSAPQSAPPSRAAQPPPRSVPQSPYTGQQPGSTRSVPQAPSTVQPMQPSTRPAPVPQAMPSTRPAPVPQPMPSTRSAPVPQSTPAMRAAPQPVPQVQPMTPPTQPVAPSSVQAPPAQPQGTRGNPPPRPQPRENNPGDPRAAPR